ncbi:hypothetical protein DOTSEDRAFT_78024 [Dothistroma septosporum NZE10]|uniref:Uncharacterized protein n=1 Tax=Dothistroma septosporum (strain NZE10 / CBS 128990) TaxID=675120 RepID=N1PXW2_DOTSN|nr:hypothetical protein DOTSEDRAFT_78024 [Dothistroma septosporum NZE10]
MMIELKATVDKGPTSTSESQEEDDWRKRFRENGTSASKALLNIAGHLHQILKAADIVPEIVRRFDPAASAVEYQRKYEIADTAHPVAPPMMTKSTHLRVKPLHSYQDQRGKQSMNTGAVCGSSKIPVPIRQSSGCPQPRSSAVPSRHYADQGDDWTSGFLDDEADGTMIDQRILRVGPELT